MVKVAVLVSGGGTNLQAILDAAAAGALPHAQIALVVSSRPGVAALGRAAKADVPAQVVCRKEYPDSASFDAALLEVLRAHDIRVVVLAGFLSILGPAVVAAYPGRILNVHPSLIPSFCGAGMYGLRVHEAALAKGVRVTGATVHFVNEVPDGGEILLQKAVEVLPGDTPETLQRRVMEQAEWQLLPRAVELVCAREEGVEPLASHTCPCRPAAEGRVQKSIEPEKEPRAMATQDIAELLRQNSYPGRGIILGRSEDGRNAVAAYFIMGRSANSRNRVFTERDGGIITEAADESKMVDPTLIIYAPVRVLGDQITIVTNGDQTDTIYDCMENGESFSKALRKRSFEPDGPNYTPRVSSYLKVTGGRMRYRMGIIKSDDGDPDSVERFFYEYPKPLPGEGRFLHTYDGDGDPIPSFTGEPRRIAIRGDIDAFTRTLWESLNEANKVSLFVRYIPLGDGRPETRIVNKYKKVDAAPVGKEPFHPGMIK